MLIFGYNIEVKDDHFIVDEKIEEYLKKNLIKERYNHSYNVAILSYEIAKKNNLENPLIYFLCGLLHDVGKYVNNDDSDKIMKENFKEYLDLPSYTYHSFVGAIKIKEELNIKDEVFLDAIKFHTTGKPNFSTLGKIIYMSDKIEPSRKYNSYDLILNAFKDYNEGFINTIKSVNVFYEGKACTLFNEMYNYYIK